MKFLSCKCKGEDIIFASPIKCQILKSVKLFYITEISDQTLSPVGKRVPGVKSIKWLSSVLIPIYENKLFFNL